MTDLNESVLNSEITLLFNNRKLNRFYILMIMFKLKREYNSRKISLEVLCDYVITIICQNDTKKINLKLFSRVEKQVIESIIYLANLELITVEGDIFKQLNKIRILITKKGCDKAEMFEENLSKKNLFSVENVLKKNKKEIRNDVKQGIDGITK